ncbi:MAG: translation initiation factor IF-1 [Candidatus Campbellbacteria bacterium]|nr:translation initiation factor IF-1 [Candidatus Campbellbacteria bacterium]
MEANNKKAKGVMGTIDESLSNANFLVTVDDTKEQVIAYVSGKMRINRIRVLVGDKVMIVLDEYGGKARIIQRL